MKSKCLALILFVAFYSNSYKAQTIVVPDPLFAAYLQQNFPNCMTGNEIQLNCPEILAVTELDISGLGLSDITGVTAFYNLVKLNCSNNSITSVVDLDLYLEYFDISYNQISDLSDFLIVDTLIARNNLFVSFPPFSMAYVTEYCDFSYNFFTSMPAIIMSASYLDVSNNQITNISNVPVSVQFLNCSYNNISNPYFNISQSSMEEIDVSFNNLTSFPSFYPLVKKFNFSNNQISNIPEPLFIYYHVTEELDISNNFITELALVNPNLKSLDCSNNQLLCLPYLPNSLEQLSFENNEISCLINYPFLLQQSLNQIPLCDEAGANQNNCEGYLILTSEIYDDQNQNCVLSSDEFVLEASNLRLFNSDNELVYEGFNSTGTVTIQIPELGVYSVEIDTIGKPYHVVCQSIGASQNIEVMSYNSSFDLKFPIECKPGFDVGTSGLFPDGWVFPGQTHALNVLAGDMSEMYGLNCASGVAGTVSFTVNGPVSYVGPAPDALTPTSVNGLSFSYSIADFGNVNSWSDFAVLLETDTTAQASDAICVSVNVTSSAGDNNPANNQFTQCYEVINSYDPNDKWVYPRLVLPGYDDYLTYTINFQNTGNAPAFNIRLEDTLSSLLDLTSFEMVYFSHDMNYKIVNNKLTVYFPNIMLADSTTNEPESKGKFIYRVKPKSNLPLGTEIDNTCHIFFDFNAPIVTNTVTTLFDVSASLPSLESNWVLYPNPNSGSFYLSGMDYESIEIVDQTGREVEFTTVFETGRTQIELQNAAPGMYFVRCVNGTQVSVKRIYVH